MAGTLCQHWAMRALACLLLAVVHTAQAQGEPACERRERLLDPFGQTRCLADIPLLAQPHGRSRGWVPAHGIYSVPVSLPHCPAVAGVGTNNNSPLLAFSSQRDASAVDNCQRGLRAQSAAPGCDCVVVLRDGDFHTDGESFHALLRLQAPGAAVVAQQAPAPASEPAPPPAVAALAAVPQPLLKQLAPGLTDRPPRPQAARLVPLRLAASPDVVRLFATEAPALQPLLEAPSSPQRLRSEPVPRGPSLAVSPLATAKAPALPAPRMNPRRALVIGNRDYQVGPLKNPVNDARAIAAELRRLAFAVTAIENLKRDDIGPTLDRFLDAIRAGDDVVLFYAGHGLQLKGVNYLPAVDARIRSESDVPLNSINLNQLLERLDESKAGVRLLMIDACRDNPYARVWRSSARGLAQISGAPAGTLLHFATRPGGVAADGDGPNGLYTTHLLRHLARAGEPLELVLKAVSAAVRQASEGQQQPWMEGSIEGDFYFVPPAR